MKSLHNIWRIHLNTQTQNWDGTEWIVDGDVGRMNYPGSLTVEAVCDYYRNGIAWEGKKDDKERM